MDLNPNGILDECDALINFYSLLYRVQYENVLEGPGALILPNT
jgi:hypothetical protein